MTQPVANVTPAKAALRAYAEASKGERCPICNGIEGCDHTVRERLLAALATPHSAALRRLLERARVILANMAKENQFSLNRWPVHHEPLRADAKSLLPEIIAALSPEGRRDVR